MNYLYLRYRLPLSCASSLDCHVETAHILYSSANQCTTYEYHGDHFEPGDALTTRLGVGKKILTSPHGFKLEVASQYAVKHLARYHEADSAAKLVFLSFVRAKSRCSGWNATLRMVRDESQSRNIE